MSKFIREVAAVLCMVAMVVVMLGIAPTTVKSTTQPTTTEPSVFNNCTLGQTTKIGSNGWSYWINAGATGSKYAKGTSFEEELWIKYGTYVDADYTCQIFTPEVNVTAGNQYTGTITIQSKYDIGNTVLVQAISGDKVIASSVPQKVVAGEETPISVTYTATASRVKLAIFSSWTPGNATMIFSADNELEKAVETTTDPSSGASAAVVDTWTTIPTNGWSYFTLSAGSKYKGGTSWDDPLTMFYGEYVQSEGAFQAVAPEKTVKPNKTYKATMHVTNSADIGTGLIRVYDAATFVLGSEHNRPIASSDLVSLPASSQGKDVSLEYITPATCSGVVILLATNYPADNNAIKCEASNKLMPTEGVNFEGYQISATYDGFRIVGSVEPQINGKSVTEFGFIYGLFKANGKDTPDTGLTDANEDTQMVVDTPNPTYVKSYATTPTGILDSKMGESDTATYIARTMKFGKISKGAFVTKYKARVYAKLSDGSYVYSNVETFTINDIADVLYQKNLMNTVEQHEYLYNTILKTVDAAYAPVAFDWDHTVVKPEKIEG